MIWNPNFGAERQSPLPKSPSRRGFRGGQTPIIIKGLFDNGDLGEGPTPNTLRRQNIIQRNAYN